MNFDPLDDVNSTPPAPPRLRLNLLAVVLGALADIGLTYVLTRVVIIAVILSVVHNGRVVDPGEVVEEMQEIWTAPLTVTCLIILGTMCTVMGGYISASLARRDYLQHSFTTGLLVLLYGFYTAFQPRAAQDPDPEWFQAFCHLTPIPAAMLGGWLRRPRPIRPKDAVASLDPTID